ncbi:hypothetical protein CFE70_009334 [Pyrenophora teres f. teres 0-1]
MAKDTHAATPKATSTDPPTPGYRPPPPPPNTAAEEQARAEALSKAKRQEWLDYEKQQEQKIHEYRNIVKLLETEILALTSKIDENKAKLAESSPQKIPDLNMDTINASNAIRIKQAYLDKETARLKRLGNELEYRQACEEARLALEQHFAKHAWASQTRAARATAEHEMQERARRQQSERFQKWQAQEQERKRKRKQEETAGSGVGEQQNTAQEPERKTRARPKSTQAAAFAAFCKCRHKGWWAKVETQRACGYCARECTRILLKCPGCQVVACDMCRRVLVTGGTPEVGGGGE